MEQSDCPLCVVGSPEKQTNRVCERDREQARDIYFKELSLVETYSCGVRQVQNLQGRQQAGDPGKSGCCTLRQKASGG